MNDICQKRGATGMEQDRSREGFSLVELIIVIAIMGTLVGLTAYGFGYMKLADAKGLANGINSGLSELKSESMAKNEPVYMHLFERDGSYFLYYSDNSACDTDEDGKNLGSSQMSIKLDGTELGAGGTKSFHIRKKDGAFEAVGGEEPPSEIEVSSDSYLYKIVLVKDTGRHYIE